MGNYMARAYGKRVLTNTRAATVILPGGEVRNFMEAVRAAEVMLESPPAFFLVNSASLHIGKRFSAVPADEELSLGNLYVMFPMARRNSMVRAADMAAALMSANSAARRTPGGKARILPRSKSRSLGELMAADESSEFNHAIDELALATTPEFPQRMIACRSKKPLLETIGEEAPVRRSRWHKLVSEVGHLQVRIAHDN